MKLSMVIFVTQTTLNSLTVGACFDCKSSFFIHVRWYLWRYCNLSWL